MKFKNKISLTIILQIRDRFEFSCRWLNFAYQNKCSYNIYIADGSENENLKNYIDKNKFYKILNIQYVKTEYDKNWKLYCNKILAALKTINTPYLLLADDDDFYHFENIQKCIDRLDDNKDLISCGANTIHFKIIDGIVSGKKIQFHKNVKSSYLSTSILDNINLYFRGSRGIYYCIHRSDKFKNGWILNNNQNFSNGRMTELFMELYLLTCGKVEFINIPFYYRQYGSSIGNSALLSNDFLDEMLKFNWHKDINKIINIISKKISNINKTKISDVKLELINGLKLYLRPWIINGINLRGNTSEDNLSRNLMIKNALKNGAFKNIYKTISIVKSYISSFLNYKIKLDKKEFLIILNFLKHYKR